MISSSAVRVSPAWDDPDVIVELIRGAGPFWPLVSYAANDAEMSALGSSRQTFTPPWFRQDFALGGAALVDGAERILENPRFADAARRIARPGAVVRATTVYVNIMGPTPFPFAPHLDVPAFRGFTRADHPVWLLKIMKTSGLFEQWRTKIATAVSWFYDGPGGDFHYWPDGPDGPGAVETAPFANVAVVADNEQTFHGVAPLGPPGARMPKGLDRESRLVRGRGGWEVLDPAGTALARLSDAEVRVTISWKAEVFADPDDARRVDAAEDPLTLDEVVDRLLADLRGPRGMDVARPVDPVGDEEWISLLADAYRDRAPVIG